MNLIFVLIKQVLFLFLLYVLIMNAFYKFKMISHSNNNVYNSHEH